MAAVSVERLDWRQWSEFAPTWERIHSQCPGASFFLTREWVDCWVATFGESLKPDLLAFSIDGDVVGCCLLVWRTQWVRGIPLRRVYLNCAGENETDSTCIEYNSVLSLPGCAEPVAERVGPLPAKPVLGRVPAAGNGGALPHLLRQPKRYPSGCRTMSSFAGFSDAAAFDSVLSSNTRHQIRRSQRLYEQSSGPCSLRVARTVQEAAEIFTRLADLHQAAWQGRGRPGVFASRRFTDFHRRLIHAMFDQNRILLVEVRAGPEVNRRLVQLPLSWEGVFLPVGIPLSRRRPDEARFAYALPGDSPLPGTAGPRGVRFSCRRFAIQTLAGDSQPALAMDGRSPANGAGFVISRFEIGETDIYRANQGQ